MQPTSENLQLIGSKLYALRHGRHEKQASVEKETGINHSVLSRIENGSYDCLTIVMLERLAKYYNVGLNELLTA